MKLNKRSVLQAVVATLLLLSSYGWTAEQVGISVIVVGEVNVTHRGKTNAQALHKNDPVYLYDLIKANKASRAKLMLTDDSILKLGPYAQLQLTELVLGRDSKTTVEQFQGRLKALIGKKLKPGSHYRVNTPVAVAGVRGTEFEIWVGINGKSAVRCLESKVDVANIDPAVTGKVILTENYYSIVEEGKAPSPPQYIDPQESLASVFEQGELEDDDVRIDAQTAQVEIDRQGLDQAQVDPLLRLAAGSATSSAIGNPVVLQTQFGKLEADILQIDNFTESSAAGQQVQQLLGLDNISPPSNSGDNSISDLAEDLFAGLVDGLFDDALGAAIGDPLLGSSQANIELIFQ